MEVKNHQIGTSYSLRDVLVNNQIKIRATVIVQWKDQQECVNYSVENSSEVSDSLLLGQNLWTVFQKNIFCDVTLLSNDKKCFPCHRIILSSRSHVLGRMLASGMIEAQTQQLEIQDYHSETVSAILEFMYKGKNY